MYVIMGTSFRCNVPFLFSAALKGSSIDFRTGRGIVVKSHLFNVSHVRVFEGAILLIRNPYESSISEFFRLQTYVQAHSSETARNLIENKSSKSFFLNSLTISITMYVLLCHLKLQRYSYCTCTCGLTESSMYYA